MTDREPAFRDPNANRFFTRRRVLTATGTGALTLFVASRVSGYADYHDDDQHDDDDDSGRGRGRGRGRGGDDDDVQPSGVVPAGSAEIRIIDDDADAFQPGEVTIDVGQSVTWVNLDDDDHTATGAGFDTGIMNPGDLATITFTEPGSFAYSCQIHPEMTGLVNVRDENGDIPATGTASPEASPQATPSSIGGEEATVTIVDIAFDPPELEVSTGTTVTWTNRDAAPHTVTASDGAFDSGALNEGDTFSYTFEDAGTFDYVCEIHPGMTASVTVTE